MAGLAMVASLGLALTPAVTAQAEDPPIQTEIALGAVGVKGWVSPVGENAFDFQSVWTGNPNDDARYFSADGKQWVRYGGLQDADIRTLPGSLDGKIYGTQRLKEDGAEYFQRVELPDLTPAGKVQVGDGWAAASVYGVLVQGEGGKGAVYRPFDGGAEIKVSDTLRPVELDGCQAFVSDEKFYYHDLDHPVQAFDVCAGKPIGNVGTVHGQIDGFVEGKVHYISYRGAHNPCMLDLTTGERLCNDLGEEYWFDADYFNKDGTVGRHQDADGNWNYEFFPYGATEPTWKKPSDPVTVEFATFIMSVERHGRFIYVDDEGNFSQLMPGSTTWEDFGHMPGVPDTENTNLSLTANAVFTSKTGNIITPDGRSNSEILYGKADLASARRVWKDGILYENGNSIRDLRYQGKFIADAMAASGPYVTSATATIDARGTAMKAPASGFAVKALFGSLAVDGSASEIAVRDVVSGSVLAKHAVPFENAEYDIWGDNVYAWAWNSGQVLEWNFRTGAERTIEVPLPATCSEKVAGLHASDGVLVANCTVVDLASGAQTPLGEVYQVDVENNRVATKVFDPATGGHKIVVRTLDFGGASAPRLLGPLAWSTCQRGKIWSPEFDFTKPLQAGALKIAKADGTVVRSIPFPESPDGSLRGIEWDGKDESGNDVPSGQYTWTVEALSAPVVIDQNDSGSAGAALPAKGIDGVNPATGSVTMC